MTSEPTPSEPTESPGRPSRPAWITWLFADRSTGRIVIGQFPNLSLWLFIGVFIISSLTPDSAPDWLALALGIASVVILAWWALDEIIRGVNPWRRMLGSAVLLYIIVFPLRELLGLG